MKKITWKIFDLKLELLFEWKISRGACNFKDNFIIVASRDFIGDNFFKLQDNKIGYSELAFNVRYGESKEKILKQFKYFNEKIAADIDVDIKNATDLNNILENDNQILFSSSLRFAISSAYMHLKFAEEKTIFSSYFNIPIADKILTSFSIPIMQYEQIKKFFFDFNLSQFKVLKIKIEKIEDVKSVNLILNLFNGLIRIDANEAFCLCEEVLRFCNQISDISRIQFIEQPFKSDNYKEQKKLKQKINIELAADESIIDGRISPDIAEGFDIVNIKLMKSGSYQRAISQIKEAKQCGLKIMLGCMVESQLGISCAYNLASLADYVDLDGFLFIKNSPFLNNFITLKDGYIHALST